ncbi:M20/M25/M40 family metallo-hydrolase [Acinetobacter radioresistens]|uniref:M20/M25/M40 family metallo-hydrolase n=1 Tax=Acinetobacter radioresistens TaxID=40216 RepID=UPI00125F45FD|nr:M20/M25/M40 family metallo-hydrolase [Acinetobacter radioresistens]
MKRQLKLSIGISIFICTSISHAASAQELIKVAESQKQPFLNTLKNLVNIESSSRDIEGLNIIAKQVAQQLKNTGAQVEIITNHDIYRMDDTPEQVGPVVKATLKGKGQTNIMLIAHMDTVYPKGSLAKQPFRIEGDKAYGLGIIDDKQGVASIIHILSILKKLNYQDYGTITVLMNSDEEISSPGSRKLISKIAQQQDVIFSFEGGGTDGSLRLATSGIGAAYLEVKGKASHAGVKPEDGVNALTELSHQILQLQDLSDAKTGLKLNWTVATAGRTRNVIPEEAQAQADVRALDNADFKKVERILAERIKNKKLKDSQVAVKFELRRPPLSASEQALSIAKQAQQIYLQEFKQPLNILTEATGGGTDAAFAALDSKAAVIEGMGVSGYGAHSNQAEYILVESIVPRLYMATRLIMDISEQKNK